MSERTIVTAPTEREAIRRCVFSGDEYAYATVNIDAVTDRIIAEHIEPMRKEVEEAAYCFEQAREALAKAEEERDAARTYVGLYRVRMDDAEDRASALEALLAECETVLLKREGSICCKDCIVIRLETTRLLAKLKARKET